MRALMQAVPDAYVHATTGAGPAVGVDLELARAQHAAVVAGMRWLGFTPLVLPVVGAGPDAIFVEDPAVVFGGRALITRSRHPVRATEGARLRPALQVLGLELVDQTDGHLDGGDVLIVGRTATVGLSSRSDAAGAAALARAFPELEVRAVPLPPGVLHLKCEVSPLDDRVLATARVARLLDHPHIEVPEAEAYAANAVSARGRVLCAAGFPRTREALDAAGFAVQALDMSEIRKGDGSITCLSLRVT
jgi:dimethylargininase